MNTNNITKLAKSLITHKTITDNTKDISSCLEEIASHINIDGINSKILNNKGVKTLHAWTQKNDRPDFLLLCHIDVVKANPEQFQPKIRMGVLKGRGAFDMKGPTAAMIEALKKNTLSNIHLVITSDEEIGGKMGANWFFQHTGIKPKIAIVPDSIDQNLITSQKGPSHLHICSHGKSAHGSRPWLGKNPIENINQAINSLNQEFNQSSTQTTCTITNINARASINQIPEKATAVLDVRTSNPKDLDKIKKILAKNNIEITKTNGDNKVFSQKTNQKIELWKEIATKTLHKKIKLKTSPSASDARHISKSTTIILTQASGSGAHSNNEWVNIKSLTNLFQITNTFIKTLERNV